MRLPYQWELRFFGLTPNDKDLFLDQIFILMYHLGFSYRDAYLLPVWQRFWFINRLKKEFDEMKENNTVSEGPRSNNVGSRGIRKVFG